MLTGLALSLALAAASPAPLPQAADRPIARYLSASTIAPEPAAAVENGQGGSRDPLKNGAITGAVIGGIVTGVGIALLCHAFNDTGAPLCWKATLLWAGIGAGAGAAVGAGVDALFTRRMTVRATVRF